MNGTITTVPVDEDGTWVIALEGEHDCFAAPLLDEQTEEVWPVCGRAIIDLGRADFIDGSIVRWLLDAKRRLDAQGSGDLVIVETPGSLPSRVLDVTDLRLLIACYPTREAARSAATAGDGIAPI